jgi:3-phosphoshikimate 1-carboxyvinyltransferase
VDFLRLEPIRHVSGRVRLPGSKSISNRVLLLSALASGDTRVGGLLDADDTKVMLDALLRLGVAWRREEGVVRVSGVGGAFPVRSAELWLGNAGTAFRPLAAALAISGGEYRLSGVARMHERPIGDLVDALRRLGAHIDYLGNEGYPPLAVHPGRLHFDAPVRVRGDVSSQFLTALLMALPLAGVAVTIEVEGELISKPYVEITINLMRRFGVEVARTDWCSFRLPQSRYASPGEILVEGDASSASYFLAAAAIGGGPVRVEGVGRDSIQGDLRFAEVLQRMGVRVSMGEDWVEASRDGGLRAVDMDFNHIPDAAMTVAVMALFAKGPSVLRNIASWRVKETDRLSAMATELRKLGAEVEEGPDYLRISPPLRLASDVEIDTYDDHRIAMSFALAALGGVPVRINNPACVAKTYPDFFASLAQISESA